jgi:pimeloyl-ACP methyl ester carboxylesterase
MFGLSPANLSGDTRRVPTVAANGVTLHYEEAGTGEPILCLHGTGSSSELWADAVATLATRGRALVYDRRGFGRSERPEPLRMDVALHADDAADLLERLRAGPAVLIGRSQGGEIALALALRRPDLVRALVLLEGGGLMLAEPTRRWLAALDELVLAAEENAVAETMLRAALGDAGWDALPDQVRGVFVANGPAIAAEHRGGYLEVAAEDLAAVTCPTLVVAAESSPPELSAPMEAAAAAIPGARLARVSGGHLIDPAHPLALAFVDEVLSG